MPFSLFALAVLAKDRHRVSCSLTNAWQSRKNEYVLWQLLTEFSSVLKTNRTTLQPPNFPILAYSPFREVFRQTFICYSQSKPWSIYHSGMFQFCHFQRWKYMQSSTAIWQFCQQGTKVPFWETTIVYLFGSKLASKASFSQNLIHCQRNNTHSENYE